MAQNIGQVDIYFKYGIKGIRFAKENMKNTHIGGNHCSKRLNFSTIKILIGFLDRKEDQKTGEITVGLIYILFLILKQIAP